MIRDFTATKKKHIRAYSFKALRAVGRSVIGRPTRSLYGQDGPLIRQNVEVE